MKLPFACLEYIFHLNVTFSAFFCDKFVSIYYLLYFCKKIKHQEESI